LDVAARYDIRLAEAEQSELVRALSGKRRPKNAEEYFAPWPILRKLFASLDAVRYLVESVVRDAAGDKVAYMELRLGAHSLVGEPSNGYAFEEYADVLADAVSKACDSHGVAVRCIFGLSRRAFAKASDSTREKSFERLLTSIEARREWFVGVDLTGIADAVRAPEFEEFFREAHRKQIGITVHAGEPRGAALSVQYAVETLSALRIGHGIAAAKCTDTMALLAKRGCTLEVCPTSNVLLGAVGSVKELPLDVFDRHHVPYVICTDNPARCRTSLSNELTKVAKQFGKSIDEIAGMMLLALRASFADEHTKSRLYEKFGATRPYVAQLGRRSAA
jgi:adenosine deaminase